MKSSRILVGLVGLSLTVGACAIQDMDMPEAAEGAALFNQNCAACHGTDADLAGREVATSAPDLRKIAQRHKGAFPRTKVLSQIDGYGRGRVSAEQMPEFGALLEGDLIPVEVDGVFTPTPRPLAALLTYLESIQS